jgi:PAS domain S-box-containing protein
MPLTLPDLIDIPKLQQLMNHFHQTTGIPVGILGSDGEILIATGWQEICTGFHRSHPVTAERCRQSDDYIKFRPLAEDYIAYKCRNGLWDIAKPIVIAGEHCATLYLGQFFYADEEIDEEFFRRQAVEFGFDAARYLAAMRRIPIFTREKIRQIMDYYSSFVDFLVTMGLANYRQAETATKLRESEEKFAKSFRANPSVLSISTIADGRYIEVNEAFERVTGFQREEVIGRTTFELNLWEIPAERSRLLQELGEKGRVQELETSFRHKSGEIIVGQLSAEIIEINGEGVLLVLFNDITARKSAEESLRVSEEEKSLILNSTIDLVVYHDMDMKVAWGNSRALDSLGMQLEELVGRRCWELWHQRSEACEGCPVIMARDTGKPQEAEIRSPDGKEWYIRGFPVKGDDGRVKGVVEFCLEITEQKRTENALLESRRLLESEKRFRSLFEHLLDGVAYCRMIYDENGKPADFVYLDVNDAFLVSTGLQDVIGKKVSEVLPGIQESSPELFELYGRVASTGRPEKCEIYVKQLSFWRSMSVYSTEKGYFVAVSENITERKRIEAELGESHHKLLELTAHLNLTREREQKAFARKVHDELGTSLTLLKFDLAWLKRHYPSDDRAVAERLKTMDEVIRECTKTVQRLTAELRPSLLDEQGLAAAIEWQAIDFERRSGIACTLAIDTVTPQLSPDQAINMYRIFQESLSNVMRHAGATSVRVSLARVGQRLVLSIMDNGVGISNYSISSVTSFGILGMEERARLCGGTIAITGNPGRGTTIEVSIPA